MEVMTGIASVELGCGSDSSPLALLSFLEPFLSFSFSFSLVLVGSPWPRDFRFLLEAEINGS